MDAEMRIDNVLDLAARQASWLLARQSLVAQNVANVNTPGYKAVDLKPFDGVIQAAALQLVKTSPSHMSVDENAADAAAPEDELSQNNETYISGNDVSMEREMLKGGEIARLYSLNAAVTKAFHGMILQSAKA
jgi:flagellar basal-body rod protein FlgB